MKNHNPKISIVIPTYNHATFLARAIESVLFQTFEDWELIIIDNYSSDRTSEILKDITDPRIRIFKFKNKGVIASSRNIGIRSAKGEWIAFLDSDDWWENTKLQLVFDHINPNVDFIYHSLRVSTGNRFKDKFYNLKSMQYKSPVLKNLLLCGNKIPNSSVVVRKMLLEKISFLSEDVDMIGCEDYNGWLRIANLTDQFLFINKKLGNYTHHSDGISQKDMSDATVKAAEPFLKALTSRELNIFMGAVKYMRGRHSYKRNNISSSIKNLSFSLLYAKKWSIKLKCLFMLIHLNYCFFLKKSS